MSKTTNYITHNKKANTKVWLVSLFLVLLLVIVIYQQNAGVTHEEEIEAIGEKVAEEVESPEAVSEEGAVEIPEPAVSEEAIDAIIQKAVDEKDAGVCEQLSENLVDSCKDKAALASVSIESGAESCGKLIDEDLKKNCFDLYYFEKGLCDKITDTNLKSSCKSE